ncbi:MAG TPA: type II toxin-antitoxin system RelE/ParE family toxin [Acidobacteriaceae bacterium]|nr:type II toxin-antitoxin system RelE/ParE family toxin [Acidobacteriaceae bacterium]
MEIRWTENAANDLAEIVAYIERDHPEATRRTASQIFDAASSLATHPMQGRLNKHNGSRELVVQNIPHLIDYDLSEHEVFILRVRHGARDLPGVSR